MNNTYKILKNEVKNVKNIKKHTIVIKRRDNKPLDIAKIKNLTRLTNEKFMKDTDNEPKIIVRGLSTRGVRTLKGTKQEIDDMFDDEEAYLSGRVKENTKFMEFTEIEITLLS